jgi:hypothetical protein
MASKKPIFDQRIARNLEEQWHIDYVVVGNHQWFEESFEPGVVEKLKVVYTDTQPEELNKIIQYLGTHTLLGADTETMGADKRAGLDPWRPDSRLLLLQIGTADQVWIIQPEYVPRFKNLLENPEITWLLHNGVFDYKFLLVKYGIKIAKIKDTMISEQVLTAGRAGMRVGLADVCRRYKPYRLISKDQRKEFINFKDRGNKFSLQMIYYAARDIVLLFPISSEQNILLEKFKLTQTTIDEFSLIPCTAMMETGGVYINQKTLGYAIAYWKERQVELEDKIIAIYEAEMSGKKAKNLMLIENVGNRINVGSAIEKKRLLKDLGFEVDNVQRETLKEIDHEVARLLADYSEVIKITSTYGENLLNRINPITGRLHPEFNQLGLGDIESKGAARNASIATGRYSSNFQQLPKPKIRFGVVKNTDLINQLDQLKRQRVNENT